MNEQAHEPTRVLLSGNVAAAEGAMRAGCRFYAGYPITPQNELIAHMADQLPLRGGVFVQAESELAAINMVYGASAGGTRAMTSSSSPGVSLKQEGISYLAGSELPAVIVNVQRAGPGLGDVRPSQADYFQATRGGGHGDYRTIALAPDSVQEMAELTHLAFELADKWRGPVLVLADGMVGQMMEPIRLDHLCETIPPPKPWALTGTPGRPRNLIRSLYLGPGELEGVNLRLQGRYEEVSRTEQRWEERGSEDGDIVLVAYGICARVVQEVVASPPAGLEGRLKLIRPITLWPFPSERVAALAGAAAGIAAVEMSAGQLVEDVRLAVEGRCPVHLFARMGGAIPKAGEIADFVKSVFN